jgi:hypothetical protein
MPGTLYEARKATSDPVRGDLVEQLYLEEGIFLKLPVDFQDELTYTYNVEKTLPGVAFRKLNEAFPESTLIVQRLTENLRPLGGDSDFDKLIARTKPKQRARNDRAFGKSMAVKWVQTLLYGNSPAARAGAAYTDADGFDGIMKRLTDAPGAPMVVDNGASSGSDGSSVFAVRFGDNYLMGLMLGPSPGIEVTNLGELQAKPVFRTRVEAAGAMAIHHGAACAWLKDITVGTAISVDKLDEAIDKVIGRPDALLMTKRTQTQLRKALRALGLTLGRDLNELGRPINTYGDIPITTSDAMLDTETVS